MQPSSTPEPSTAAASFAGFLSRLAAPAEAVPGTWKDDELADDIATLSYENALRTHQRYRTTLKDALSSPEPQVPDFSTDIATGTPSVRPDRTPKNASITIRLSQAECQQLHQRAAEADMTISAYLRSCTLEVENLRAQVKQTLADLRHPTPTPSEPVPPLAPPHSWRRFWPFDRHKSAAHGLSRLAKRSQTA